jgi:hypothetical protein
MGGLHTMGCNLVPSTLACLDQSLLASVCHSNPHQGILSTTVTALHMTQGRVEYVSTIPRGTNEGLDLWGTLRLQVNILIIAHMLVLTIKLFISAEI